jgi:hypothetical protein
MDSWPNPPHAMLSLTTVGYNLHEALTRRHASCLAGSAVAHRSPCGGGFSFAGTVCMIGRPPEP